MSLGDGLSLAGLLVSVVGFGLTIWQLVRTANAAEATRAAIIGANKRMLLNHLLVLLPQMRSLESDLDLAIAANDLPSAVRALNGFSHAANQIASLLDTEADAAEDGLRMELRAAAASASLNKSVLVRGTVRPLRTVLKTCSAQISDVSAQCAGLTTKYQVKAA